MNIHDYAAMIKTLHPVITEVLYQNENYYQIETPFLDLHNDMLYFNIVRDDEGIFLTDEGEIINNYHSGYDYSLLIQKFCDKVINLPFVNFTGSALKSETITKNKFPQILTSFIQAMILCSNIEYKELC